MLKNWQVQAILCFLHWSPCSVIAVEIWDNSFRDEFRRARNNKNTCGIWRMDEANEGLSRFLLKLLIFWLTGNYVLWLLPEGLIYNQNSQTVLVYLPTKFLCLKVSRNLLQFSDAAFLHKDPLGVVFIIGTWNFPIQLLLLPAVGALAAGNCVILKPSHVALNTETVICKLIAKYMDHRVCCAIAGSSDETKWLFVISSM